MVSNFFELIAANVLAYWFGSATEEKIDVSRVLGDLDKAVPSRQASTYCCARIRHSAEETCRGLIRYIRPLGSNGLLGPFLPSLSLLPSEPPTVPVADSVQAEASFLPLGLEHPESGPFPQSLPFLPFEPIYHIQVIYICAVFRPIYVYAMVAPMTNKSWVTTGWSMPATYLKL